MMGLYTLDYDEFIHQRALSWSFSLSCSLLFLFLMWGHSEKVAICKPEKQTSPYFNTALWSQMLSLRNGEKINVCCLSHPVYGICYGNSGRLRCRLRQILSEIRETCYIPVLFIINLITNLKGSMRKEN